MPSMMEAHPHEAKAMAAYLKGVEMAQTAEITKSEKMLWSVLEAYHEHPQGVRAITVARTCRVLGEALARQNKLSDALAMFRKGVVHAEILVDQEIDNGKHLLGMLLDFEGKVRVALGDLPAGRAAFTRALAQLTSLEHAVHCETLRSQIAETFAREGLMDEALAFLTAEVDQLLAEASQRADQAKVAATREQEQEKEKEKEEKEKEEREEEEGEEGEGGGGGSATTTTTTTTKEKKEKREKKKGTSSDDRIQMNAHGVPTGPPTVSKRLTVEARMLRHGGISQMVKASELLAQRERYDDAIDMYRRAISELKAMHGDDSTQVISSERGMVNMLRRRGRPEDLRECVRILEAAVKYVRGESRRDGEGEEEQGGGGGRTPAALNPALAQALLSLSRFHMSCGDAPPALGPLEEALAILEAVVTG